MESPHYGVKGWLLVIYVLHVLSALLALSTALNVDVFGTDPLPWQLVALAQLALLLPFLALTPLKHPLMPVISIACAWVSVLIALIFYGANWSSIINGMEKQAHSAVIESGGTATAQREFVDAFQTGLLFGVVFVLSMKAAFAALVTWYLLVSKRVNATFRHRIPSGLALSMAQPAPGVRAGMDDFRTPGLTT